MNDTRGPGPVVVGVDYSITSAAALSYAAWEAERRGAGLRLVHGYVAPEPDDKLADLPYDDNERIVAAEERLLEASLPVRRAHPNLSVSTKVVAGSGGMSLVNESAVASLVVVGAVGRGGFDGLLVGSVAAQVSRHSQCPVLVVRPGPAGGFESGPGSVLVGVDGSPSSADALSFGFDEAAARGVQLVAVHVWSIPAVTARSVGVVWSARPSTARAQLNDVAMQVLDEALAGWQEKYPQVEVERRSPHSDEPARTLLEVASVVAADLIVVGSRSRDGAAVVLGSVSQALVAHAQASVAVLDPERRVVATVS